VFNWMIKNTRVVEALPACASIEKLTLAVS
jgi:hypothetical protein